MEVTYKWEILFISTVYTISSLETFPGIPHKVANCFTSCNTVCSFKSPNHHSSISLLLFLEVSKTSWQIQRELNDSGWLMKSFSMNEIREELGRRFYLMIGERAYIGWITKQSTSNTSIGYGRWGRWGGVCVNEWIDNRWRWGWIHLWMYNEVYQIEML